MTRTCFRGMLALIFSTSLIGCTTTIRKKKNPDLAISKDSLATGLNGLVSAEHYGLDGEDISVNGKDSSTLEIDVINGKGIPSEGDSLRAFGLPVAALLKSALKDKGEYDKFMVCFVKVDSTAVGTKRSWVGYIYPSAGVH